MNAPAKIDEVIEIKTSLPAIEFDFEAAKRALEEDLKKYDVVVTEETLADSKKLATQLNKSAQAIDKLRKDVIAQVSAPIKEKDAQLKELVQLYKDGRQKVTVQVEKFEAEKLAIAEQLLKELRAAQWDQQGVSEEFRAAQYDDLVKLGALTKKQQLTSATANELIQRVQGDKAQQDRIKMRLMQLENASLKAGLTAPLTREHVNHFLFQDESSYEEQLQAVIARELDRQQQAEEAMRKKLEQERKPEEPQKEASQVGHSPLLQKAVQHAAWPSMAPPPAFSTAAQVASYGPLTSPSSATEIDGDSEQAAQQALLGSDQMPWGVWIDGELVAIAYQGKVFRK